MSRIFGRRARLTVGTLRVESEGEKGLRFAFQIRKTTDISENSARIQIYNLSEDTRARLSEEAQGLERNTIRHLVLEAGYEGDVRTIFTGDKAWISHRRQGTDWVTTVETLDGARALSKQVSKTYAPNTSAKDILKDLQEQAGLAWQQIKQGGPVIETVTGTIFAAGKSITGSTRGAIKRIADEAQLEVSVQDGELLLHAVGGDAPSTGLVLSTETGLVGTPEVFLDPSRKTQTESGKASESPFTKNANLVRGQCLLNGLITPGHRFSLDSDTAFANAGATFGLFRAINVDHVGDTHGGSDSWLTSWEAEEVSDAAA